MEYVGIAIVVVSIAIFCIYKLANNLFGLNLRLKPLILCGGCAVFISIVLPRIVVSVAGFIGTMSVLAVFAIVFAYFVAYYDDLHESTEHVDGIEIAASQNEIAFEKNVATNQAINPLLPAIINEKFNEADVSAAKTETKDDSKNMKNTIEIQGMEIHPEPDSDSLDDLLNFAFSHKEQNDFNIALDAFMRAYKLYHDNEVAPFLVVEIGNILKHKGFYDEAINIFIEGRNLPILKDQQTFEQEFVNTIAYLRILKNILLQHHMNFVPFKEISPQILEEIDKEFQDWRNIA